MSDIGARIRRMRLLADKTLEDVAQETGVSRQTMSRYETGVISAIPSDKIEAIAKYVGTTPAYLMGWEKIKDTPFNDEHILEKMQNNPKLKEFIYYILSLDDDQLKIFVDDALSIYDMIVAARNK